MTAPMTLPCWLKPAKAVDSNGERDIYLLTMARMSLSVRSSTSSTICTVKRVPLEQKDIFLFELLIGLNGRGKRDGAELIKHGAHDELLSGKFANVMGKNKPTGTVGYYTYTNFCYCRQGLPGGTCR